MEGRKRIGKSRPQAKGKTFHSDKDGRKDGRPGDRNFKSNEKDQKYNKNRPHDKDNQEAGETRKYGNTDNRSGKPGYGEGNRRPKDSGYKPESKRFRKDDAKEEGFKKSYGNGEQPFRKRSQNNDGEYKKESGFERKPRFSRSGDESESRPQRESGDRPFRKRIGKEEGYRKGGDGERKPRFSKSDNNRESRPTSGGEEYPPQKRVGKEKPHYKKEGNFDKPRYPKSEESTRSRPYKGKSEYPARKESTSDYSKPRPSSGKPRGKSNKPSGTVSDGEIRLNKYIANAGICSRREADDYIASGAVTVNGTVVSELGSKVKPTDVVNLDGLVIKAEKKVYILLNKPKDFVTTVDDPHATKTVMDLIKHACTERVYPVGRLDRNSTGVLLFTNDGELTKRLTHPKYMKRKIYHIHIDKNLSKADMQKLVDGVELEDGLAQADVVSFPDEADKKQIGVEIHSGRNRIIRRMFETIGYKVLKLDRVYFAGLTKKNVPRGKWRFLTEKEVNLLMMNAFS